MAKIYYRKIKAGGMTIDVIMAKIYYRKIKAGGMTIDEVPERWRAAVQELLDNDPEYDPD